MSRISPGVRLAVAVLRLFAAFWIAGIGCATLVFLVTLSFSGHYRLFTSFGAFEWDAALIGIGILLALGFAMWAFAGSIEEDHYQTLEAPAPRRRTWRALWFYRSLSSWALFLFLLLFVVHAFQSADIIPDDSVHDARFNILGTTGALVLAMATQFLHRIITRKLENLRTVSSQ